VKKKNKVALMGISGLLATSLAVGGATFALFKSEVTNEGNTVSAGTLKITAKRNDVPNEGPMFYTQNVAGNYGGMPTGLWAPGDKHTRGLFLENTGSLDARLTTLTVTPADSNGNAVTSGSQYEDNLLFARQAKVKIWDIQEFDPLSGRGLPGVDSEMTADEMDFIMDVVNIGYDMWLALNPTADLTDQTVAADLLTTLNEYMFQELSKKGGSLDNRQFKVVKMYDKNLINFVNTPFDASSFGIELPPEKAALLGFTVEFKKNPGNSIDKNSMQGKQVYFNFGSDWVQTKNN
jgi:spore coat-associated protein N